MLHRAFAFHFFHSYHILNRIASTQCLFYGKANSILRIVIVHATSLLILRQGQSLRQDKFSARPSPFTKTFNDIPFRMNKMAKFVTSIIIKNENQRIIYSKKRSRVRKKGIHAHRIYFQRIRHYRAERQSMKLYLFTVFLFTCKQPQCCKHNKNHFFHFSSSILHECAPESVLCDLSLAGIPATSSYTNSIRFALPKRPLTTSLCPTKR